jgi:hypothetical protein
MDSGDEDPFMLQIDKFLPAPAGLDQIVGSSAFPWPEVMWPARLLQTGGSYGMAATKEIAPYSGCLATHIGQAHDSQNITRDKSDSPNLTTSANFLVTSDAHGLLLLILNKM